MRANGCSRTRDGALVLLGIVCCVASCKDVNENETAGANVSARSALLITLDTTRYDALHADLDITPVLDGLARESLSFDACRTVAPLTLPSHASMLTGLYPPRHGIRDNGYAALPDELSTLAEHARTAGLRTGAFVAAVVLDRRFGLDQGFQTYSQPERPEREVTHVYAERPATEVVRDASTWLRSLEPGERFFAWVHLFDPHAPYAPAPEFLERADGDPYLGEIAATDHAVGELLAALRDAGHADTTLVAVTADHGEDRMQHGEPTHASFCYDTTIQVPMILHVPGGHRAGERSSATVSVVDLYPTLLTALGIGDPGGHDGHDLLQDGQDTRGVYFETYYNFINYGWSPLVGWADAEGKYIHSSAPELYVTTSDPGERHNTVHSADASRIEAYRRQAAEVVSQGVERRGSRTDPDDQLTRQLQSLGYAGGVAPTELPSPFDGSDLPAPNKRVDELHTFLEASELSDLGRCPEALPLFAKVVDDNPRNRIALDRYAFCLIQGKSWETAARVLRQRIDCGQASAATHINLGVCLQNLKRPEEAIEHYKQALTIDPSHKAGRGNLARLLDSLGRSQEAEPYRSEAR